MFAISGDTQLLPTNTIYKALHLYDTWTKIGPKGAFYVRTASKWFDVRWKKLQYNFYKS